MFTLLLISFFLFLSVIGIHDILDSLGLFDDYFIYLRKVSKKHWYYDDYKFHRDRY